MLDVTSIRVGLAVVCIALAAVACDRRPKTETDEPVIEPAAPGEDVAPQKPATAPVYYGVWAAKEDLCDIAPGSADPSPIAFAEGEFVGYENRCHIGEVQEGTEGGYRLSLVCVSEGVEAVQTLDVDVDGETLRLKWQNGGEATFVRCKEEE